MANPFEDPSDRCRALRFPRSLETSGNGCCVLPAAHPVLVPHQAVEVEPDPFDLDVWRVITYSWLDGDESLTLEAASLIRLDLIKTLRSASADIL